MKRHAISALCPAFCLAGCATSQPATNQAYKPVERRTVAITATSIDQKIFLFRACEDGSIERRVIHPNDHGSWPSDAAWRLLDKKPSNP